MVYDGISIDGLTDLHINRNGALTGRRYRGDIVWYFAVPYATAIGVDFILMDNYCRPQRAKLENDFLLKEGIIRIEWPACSPDMTQ